MIRFVFYGGWCRGGDVGDIIRIGVGFRDFISIGMGECVREYLFCFYFFLKLVSLEVNVFFLRVEVIKFNVFVVGDVVGMGVGMVVVFYFFLILKYIWIIGYSVYF